MERSRFPLRLAVLAAALSFIPGLRAPAFSAELSKSTISARVVSVAADKSTAVINRGKGENIIPGSPVVFRPNRGENEADIEWDIPFAKGTVQSVGDGSSVVKLTDVWQEIQPRDYCEVGANIPPSLWESDLGRVALFDFKFLDRARQAPLFTLAELIRDPSPRAGDAILERLLVEVRATGPAVIDEKFKPDRIKGGLFDGMTLKEVFRASTRAHIEKFVEFVAWYPGRYVGYDWPLVDAYANWAYLSALSGERLKKAHQSEPSVLKGDGLLAQGKYQEALAEYNNALIIDPENGTAKTKIETVNRVLERLRMLQEDDKDVPTRHALGLDFFKLRLYGLALEQFQKAKDLGDDSAEVERYLGFTHAALDHYAEARAVLEPLAARSPEDAGIRKWLDFVRQNEVLAKQGPNVASFMTIGEIRYREGDETAAINEFNQALALAPKEASIWKRIGQTALRRRARREEGWAKESWQKGDFDQARSHWQTALEDCKLIDDRAAMKAILRGMGAMMYDSSRYADAAEVYRKILDLDPEDADACVEVARCYKEIKDFDPAVEWAERAAAKNPKSAWAYDVLGAIHEDAGRIDQALANYGKAVELDPNYAQPVYNLGTLSALKGEYEKAGAYFRRALEIDNDYADARTKLIDAESILEARETLRVAPDDGDARSRLVAALFDLDDYDRAIAESKEALRSAKDAAWANEQLGHCLIRQGKYAEGKAALEESFRLRAKPDVEAWSRFVEARLLLQKNPQDPAAELMLGDDSRYWESYDDALSHFGRAQELGAAADAVSGRMELARRGKEARRQLDLSAEYYNRAQFEKAVECAERSRALYSELGARRGEFNALLRTGWSRAAMFRHEEALDAYTRAGRVAEALQDDKTSASYLSSLSDYYWGLGESEKALDLKRQAGRLWLRTNDLVNVAWVVLPGVGGIEFNLGRSADQLASFEQALAIHRKLLYAQGEAYLLVKIASASELQGDFSRAIESYGKALAIAQKRSLPDTALSAYAGLGDIYASVGDVENARKYLQDYLDAAVALGRKTERANALNKLGLLYLDNLKDYAKAMGLFEESRGLSRLIGDATMESVAVANIAVTFSRRGDYREALARYDEVMRLIRATKDRYLEMQGLNELGETHLGLKDYVAALDCQLKAREIAVFLGVRAEQWQYELAAGKSYEGKGDPAKAAEFYMKAAETLKGIKNKIGSEKLLKNFSEQERQTEVYKRLIALLLKSGQTEAAFRYVEESKSKLVKDAFGDIKPAAADADLKQTLQAVDTAEKRKEALEGELQKEKQKPAESQDAKKLETLTKTLATTEGEFNQWMIRLKFQNRKMYDALTIKPAELADVQHQIPAGAVFLEYFIAPEELYVFGIGRDFFLARSTAVTEADLTTLVNRFVRLCSEPPSGGTERLTAMGKQLYQDLVAPVDDIVEKAETIVVIPFGVLYYLPFQALCRDNGGRLEYLIERKRLCYTTSATFADILKNEPRATKSFMAFGNADGKLPAAADEVRTLGQKIFKANATVLVSNDATKEAFLKQAKNFNIIHLATHGVIETNPLDSYILFAGPSKESQELTLLEVAGYTALREKNSLVFLSACQTAREAGKAGTGSELITLAEAFAMAGAPTLVATLWQVEDSAARLFAFTFYDELMNKKKDKLDALRAGQVALIRSADYSHPFFWAPFIMIGSWR